LDINKESHKYKNKTFTSRVNSKVFFLPFSPFWALTMTTPPPPGGRQISNEKVNLVGLGFFLLQWVLNTLISHMDKVEAD
jgi:hypothetical protein